MFTFARHHIVSAVWHEFYMRWWNKNSCNIGESWKIYEMETHWCERERKQRMGGGDMGGRNKLLGVLRRKLLDFLCLSPSLDLLNSNSLINVPVNPIYVGNTMSLQLFSLVIYRQHHFVLNLTLWSFSLLMLNIYISVHVKNKKNF